MTYHCDRDFDYSDLIHSDPACPACGDEHDCHHKGIRTMKIITESHTANLTANHLQYIVDRFANRDAFFIETIILPEPLSEVECALYGPTMNDAPIDDADVTFGYRGDRTYASRLIESPMRLTRTLTVIAGPHGDEPCVLYTAHGGPVAPKEPGDPTLQDHERSASRAFWAEHALSSPAVKEKASEPAPKPTPNEAARAIMKMAARAILRAEAYVATAVGLRARAVQYLEEGDMVGYAEFHEKANEETNLASDFFLNAARLLTSAEEVDGAYFDSVARQIAIVQARVVIDGMTPEQALMNLVMHYTECSDTDCVIRDLLVARSKPLEKA